MKNIKIFLVCLFIILAFVLAVSPAKAQTSAWCHNFLVPITTTNEIFALHTALQKQGISYSPDGATTYKAGTITAVKLFQAEYGISQTGTVGPLTRTKLNSLYGCHGSSNSQTAQTNQNTQTNTNYVLPNPPVQQCVSNWKQLSDSGCVNGKDTIKYYDANYCQTGAVKPDSITNCNCAPIWSCSGFGSCINGLRTQTCNDRNKCGITTNEPPLTQSCSNYSTFTENCTPQSCSQLSKQCGDWDNGCGTQINCGNCSSGQTCSSLGQCTSTPPGNSSCVPSWQCTWGDCYYNNGQGVRINNCIDTNNCGTTANMPPLSENCDLQCTPLWTCSQQWGPCIKNITTGQYTHSKTCVDTNGCNTTAGMPNYTQNCVPNPSDCVSNWQCTVWGSCNAQGVYTRTCTDANKCATPTTPKPNESLSCGIPSCISSWQCTAWSGCNANGYNTRTCTDINKCGTPINKPTESDPCVGLPAQGSQTSSCVSNWQCPSWNPCANGIHTRASCTDVNHCAIPTDTPSLIDSCVKCTPIWQCSDWSSNCSKNVSGQSVKTRACTNTNGCADAPELTPKTEVACTQPQWQCTAWGSCAMGSYRPDLYPYAYTHTRTCTDVNNIGTTSGKPIEWEYCTPTAPSNCTEDWHCGDWTVCVANPSGGYWHSRNCNDYLNCGTIVKRPNLVESCTPPVAATASITSITTNSSSIYSGDYIKLQAASTEVVGGHYSYELIFTSPSGVFQVGQASNGQISYDNFAGQKLVNRDSLDPLTIQFHSSAPSDATVTATISMYDLGPQYSAHALINQKSVNFNVRPGSTANCTTLSSINPNNNWVPVAGTFFKAGGTASVGLYDPSASIFYLRYPILNNSTECSYSFGFGAPGSGWIPIFGDWRGTGMDGAGLYSPSTNTFYIKYLNTTGTADLQFHFDTANSGLIPIAGDWDGDGKAGVGLYDPKTSTFMLKNSLASGSPDLQFNFGSTNAGWLPIAGDWNGDGVDTIGLYSPSTGTFYLRNSNSAGVADFQRKYAAGQKPVTGAWGYNFGDSNSNSITRIGVYNPSTLTFELRNNIDLAGSTLDLFDKLGSSGNWTENIQTGPSYTALLKDLQKQIASIASVILSLIGH